MQSTQDFDSQSTQRCDCNFSSTQYHSFSPKKICEVCWLELLRLLWDALPSCMLSHFLPAGNPNSRGFHWSPAPHNCNTQQLSSQALSYSTRNVVAQCWAQQGALRACHFWGETLSRRALPPHCAKPRRCREPAAPLGSSTPSCRCGRFVHVGPAPLAQALWKARLLRKMRWSNRLTAPLENYCVKERISSEDLNFCRVARARPKSNMFALELCIWAIAWNWEIGHRLWLLVFCILLQFCFFFSDCMI